MSDHKTTDPFYVSPWSFPIYPVTTPTHADFLKLYLDKTRRDIERAIVLQEGPLAKSRGDDDR